MATQPDVDALTAATVAEDAELNTAVSDLQASVAAIAALLAVPPAQLDLAALQARWRPARPWPTRAGRCCLGGGARSPGDQLI